MKLRRLHNMTRACKIPMGTRQVPFLGWQSALGIGKKWIMCFSGKVPPVVQLQPVVARLKHRSFGHSVSDFLEAARNLDDYVKFAGSIMSAIY